MSIDIDQFKRHLKYEDCVSPEDLSASIQQIREVDKSTEGHLRTTFRTMGISVLVGILSIIGFAATDSGFILLLAPLSGIAFVVTIVTAIVCRQHDLPDRRYELLQDLANALRRDMPKDGQFKVTLDLSSPTEKRKKVNQQKVGGWNVVYYDDPWLKLEGALVDGTAFAISMLERFQVRSKWKRSASGKSKFKKKTKSATVASVKLYPKRKRYTNLEQVTGQASQFLLLPNWATTRKVVADADTLALTTFTDAEWAVKRDNAKVTHDGSELLIKMLLSLYQVLHASKAAGAA